MSFFGVGKLHIVMATAGPASQTFLLQENVGVENFFHFFLHFFSLHRRYHRKMGTTGRNLNQYADTELSHIKNFVCKKKKGENCRPYELKRLFLAAGKTPDRREKKKFRRYVKLYIFFYDVLIVYFLLKLLLKIDDTDVLVPVQR